MTVRTHASDKLLFATITGLVLFGLVMIYSASAVVAMERHGTPYYFVLRQAVFAGLGLLGMLVTMHIDYRRYNNPVVVYGCLALVLLMLLAVFAFPAINGAHRWIRFAGQQFQPSELAKVALVLFLAFWLDKHGSDPTRFWRVFAPCAAVGAAVAVLVAAEPDLGTGLGIGVTLVVMLFAAGIPARQLALLPAGAAGPVAAMVLLVPFRLKRLVAFLDPWADPMGSGYHVVQSMLAVGSGGLWGVGLSQGRQKLFYLPEPHTDFIFAVISEELGLVGAVTVLVVFAVLAWRGLRAAGRAPDDFGTYLATGLTVLVVAQALFNISVVLALVPTKGIPLPFISYGGSSLSIGLTAMGILLNVSQGK
jgi:cell division protein FtsW